MGLSRSATNPAALDKKCCGRIACNINIIDFIGPLYGIQTNFRFFRPYPAFNDYLSIIKFIKKKFENVNGIRSSLGYIDANIWGELFLHQHSMIEKRPCSKEITKTSIDQRFRVVTNIPWWE